MNKLLTSNKFINFANIYLKKWSAYEEYFYRNFYYAFIQQSPHMQYAIDCNLPSECFIEKDVEISSNLDDHILWAVPKTRRSVEVRRSRRIGALTYFCKLLPRKKLLTCLVCGHPHEVGILCPNCYEKVMKVTKSIQEAMKKADGRNPVESDYEPVFQGEKLNGENGFYKGKRIIEVEDQRPTWFAKKLTQKANVTESIETSPAVPNPLHIKG